MGKHLTKTEIKSYLNSWKALNDKELKLLQDTSPSAKLLQFFSLMASAHLFGMYATKTKENKDIRRRWQIIRRKMKSV